MAANEESKILEDKKKTVLRDLIKLPTDSDDIAITKTSVFDFWQHYFINSSNAIFSLPKKIPKISFIQIPSFCGLASPILTLSPLLCYLHWHWRAIDIKIHLKFTPEMETDAFY